METAQIDRQSLAHELAGAMPSLDEEQQRIAITLYRLLADGEPVAPAALAQRAGVDPIDVERLFNMRGGTYFDDQGRVVGFWGMALAGMPHRIHVDGHEIRAWCAWDTLFLPELIVQTITVESPCPTTGATVGLVVEPDAVREVAPAGAVLSFLRPQGPFDADVIKSFCHFVHFFVSAEAAAEWTARRDGTFVMSIADGFAIAREVNRLTFGAELEHR